MLSFIWQIGAELVKFNLTGNEEDFLYALFLRGDQYALEIKLFLDQSIGSGKEMPLGSLYSTLKRLEERQLVSSYWSTEKGAPEDSKPRRHYHLEELGQVYLAKREQRREIMATLSQQPVFGVL